MISLRRRYVCSGWIAFVENRKRPTMASKKSAYNFDEQAAVKQLIMERFDIYAEKNGVGSPEETTASNGHRKGDSPSAAPSPPPSASPVKRDVDSEEASPVDSEPPAKKLKPDVDADVDADALYAAKLQAEENLRARPTRGGTSRRAAPSKKKSKTKTSKRVKAEDDSDIETGSDTNTKKEVNRTGGFHVRYIAQIEPNSGF
jgi:upstream activation factor subunit UAF30